MDVPAVDILWVLIATGLVFVMQGGFLCLEAGLTRTKNSINVAIKNMADFGISLTLFWVFGFALMFGLTIDGWVGGSHFLAAVGGGDAWLATFFIFQAVFCGTAVTIVSGAVAERVRFVGYLLMAVVISALVYPLFGHWAWGGAYAGEPGWLGAMGFIDFAGSSVVHSVGGWAGLAAVVVIGPRFGRFAKGQKPREISASNLPMAMLGTMLLWFGWIGFNGGSTLALDGTVPGIIANTMLAAGAGMLTAMGVGWLARGFPHPSAIINGALAGLVAITANCHAVSAGEAVLIGAVGGLLCLGAMWLLDRLGIDDAIGAVPVHLVAGVWGTLAVGLFGNLDVLGTGLSRLDQLSVQLVGVAACGAWAFGLTYGSLRIINVLCPMRVSLDDEKLGLNVAEHRATNDLHDFVNVIEEQAQTGDLSRRAPVEPFTEVGQIAARYNMLMEYLQQSKTDIDSLKKTQKALEEASRLAERANNAKSEFLANMSHEIRTPLHGILSFAGFGLKKGKRANHEKIEEYFRKIDVSGRRLLMLVNDLLDLAKLESGKMTFEFDRYDLVGTIHNVADEFGSLLSEKSMKVRFDRPAEEMFITCDQMKVMQVVRNLLNNAIKFSPEQASVDVTLSRRDEGVRITVRDHGMGVPEQELQSIFDKFIQSSKTNSGAGGTGLGLAICQEIVKGHGGRIWAENHPEGGACFNVDLPLEPPRRDVSPETTGEARNDPESEYEAVLSRG